MILGSGAQKLHLGYLSPEDRSSHMSRAVAPIFRNRTSFYLDRTYFRIQRKCQTCSKRSPYLGNTSWPNSLKLMIVTIGLNRLSSCTHFFWFTGFFKVSPFLSEIMRIPGNGRTRNLDNFYFFFFQEIYSDTTTKV